MTTQLTTAAEYDAAVAQLMTAAEANYAFANHTAVPPVTDRADDDFLDVAHVNAGALSVRSHGRAH